MERTSSSSRCRSNHITTAFTAPDAEAAMSICFVLPPFTRLKSKSNTDIGSLIGRHWLAGTLLSSTPS